MTRSDQSILVPLDGSPLAELALAEALALAGLPNTEDMLLQVIPPIEEVITIGLQEITLDQRWDLQKERALRYLRTIAARPEFHGVQVNVAVEMGKPAETILAFAGKHGVNRIVMSTARPNRPRPVGVRQGGRQNPSRSEHSCRPGAPAEWRIGV